MENAKKWMQLVLLLGIGVAVAVSAAFLCAGVIIFALEHSEAAVFCIFAIWILRFGWNTRADAGLDAEEDGDIGLYGDPYIYEELPVSGAYGRLGEPAVRDSDMYHLPVEDDIFVNKRRA